MQGLRIFQMRVKGAIPAKIIISTVLLIFLSGCGGVSESAVKSVLEKDPDFRRSLDAKKRVKKEIASLQREMEPKIEALRVKLAEARSEYKNKKKILKDLLHKSKSIKKLLAKKKDLSLSGDELSIWKKRAIDLEKEITAAGKSIESLQSKTSLLKAEIRILRE